MTNANNRSALYRLITVLGFLLAIALGFIIPYHMREPDSWAYYFATENFSQGKLVVDDQLHQQQVEEAKKQEEALAKKMELSVSSITRRLRRRRR